MVHRQRQVLDTLTIEEAFLDRVTCARRAGENERAIALANLGLNRRPAASLERALLLERALARHATGNHARAEADCRRALKDGSDSQTRALLGECLLSQGRAAEAVVELEVAVSAGTPCPEWWGLLARALTESRQRERAALAAKRAWELAPSGRTAATYARALATAGRHRDAVDVAERGLDRWPQQASLLAALATSLQAQGRIESAMDAWREALTADPESVEVHCSLAHLLLSQGRLEEGFRHNEHRQKNAGNCRRLGVAPWRGEDLRSKHLLVWCEQGLGDTIQFARFLPLARKIAARTTFVVPPPLVRLLESNPLLGSIATHHPGFGAADHQVLVMSLPHCLSLGDDIMAASPPYLFPEPARIERWRGRLPPGRKIALVWQGNPNYAGDAWRSMPFAALSPLISSLGRDVTFLSLQKNFGREQLASSPLRTKVIDLSSEIDSDGHAFVDSLAVLAEVDLLITTDTSMAHVAGAAGIGTWLLLGPAPDWRWGIEGQKTPWYPSARLFRRSPSDDWDRVIGQVLAALGAEWEMFPERKGYAS